ncbi:MAG: hypothetical protein ACXWIN_05370 [Burkholderiaceae bacterium]
MSSTSVSRNGSGYSPDFNDLGGANIAPQRSVMRTQLLPGELEASLPSQADQPHNTVAPLTRFLGPLLTVGNPAWVGDPIPRMRALQKTFVEHSLTLPEADRGDLMGAISMVEKAVLMRLRLQQMRMTDAELENNPKGGKS